MNSIFEKINTDFNLLLLEKAKVAADARRLFLDAKLSNLKDSGRLVEFILRFQYYYKALIFFPDQEVLEKINGFNIPGHLFIPFVDISEISREFFALESHNIYTSKSEVLLLIEIYLDIQIAVNSHRWFYHLKGKDDEECIRYYRNIERRIDYGLKNGKKLDSFDEVFYDEITKPGTILETLSGKNFIGKAYSGNADWILPYIFSYFFYIKDTLVLFEELNSRQSISQNEFLGKLFSFFRLFVQNKSMLTEQEFEQRTDMRYSGYNRYKAQRMKKLVRPSSKIGSRNHDQ